MSSMIFLCKPQIIIMPMSSFRVSEITDLQLKVNSLRTIWPGFFTTTGRFWGRPEGRGFTGGGKTRQHCHSEH
jgi:hypothetical protein